MSDQRNVVPVNPTDVLGGGVRGEVLGCPTGLAGLHPEPPPTGAPQEPEEAGGSPNAPHLVKLEGRQESGRDGQDEREQDEGP